MSRDFFCRGIARDDIHPVAAVLERKPEAFLRFLRSSLQLSLVLAVARIPVLAVAWHWRTAACSRPLHVWLAVEAVLAVAQVPLRGGILAHLPKRGDAQAVPLVQSILCSQASQSSEAVGTVHYVWTLIGLLWALGAECEEGPLLPCTRVVVAFAIIRAVAILAIYFHGIARPSPLQIVPFSGSTQQSIHGHCTCAVCLTEFAPEQPLRVLACKHAFCVGCADKWLKVRRVCPVCMRAT